jgi:colicin import membrane protein
MPAEPTVTLADVIAAGNDIQCGGRRVSGGALRNQIGRGSTTRLMALWEQHLAGATPAQDAPATAPAVALPPALVELEASLRERAATELSSLLTKTWSTAERVASERLATEIQRAMQQAEDAVADSKEMEAALTKADQQREKAEAELGEAERRAIAAETLAQEHERRFKDKADEMDRAWTTALEEEERQRRELERQLSDMRDARLAAETLAVERGRLLELLAPTPAADPVPAQTDLEEAIDATKSPRKRQAKSAEEQPAA